MGSVCAKNTKKDKNSSSLHVDTMSTTNMRNSSIFLQHFSVQNVSSPRKNYQKGEVLGEGTCGKVYQCLNHETGEIFAVKSIQLKESTSLIKKEINRLKEEIRILKKLSHRNIIKYISTKVDEEKGLVDIVLEYIPGGSLKDLIKKYGKLNEKVVSLYTKQILEALQYLHQNQIIHRDIKGANVLIDIDGTIKLTDFGISKCFDLDMDEIHPNPLTKSLKGSPNWMSPEVAMRIGHSYQTDIWSLGCIVIEMLTGKPPFYTNDDRLEVILSLIGSGKKPVIPKNISPECLYFLNSCLQKNPNQRLKIKELLELPFIKNYESNEKKDISSTRSTNFINYDDTQLPSLNKIKKNQIAMIPQKNERIINTVLSQKIREQKKLEDQETRNFNQQRKKKWEEDLLIGKNFYLS